MNERGGGHPRHMQEELPEQDDHTSETVRNGDPAEDTSGGPPSSGAGEGSGQDAPDAPDIDVPGGADEGA